MILLNRRHADQLDPIVAVERTQGPPAIVGVEIPYLTNGVNSYGQDLRSLAEIKPQRQADLRCPGQTNRVVRRVRPKLPIPLALWAATAFEHPAFQVDDPHLRHARVGI